jgi:hypothetical protein
MSTISFYEERAAECRQQASETQLTNVKDRCLSAAVAWDSMADRLKKTRAFREANGHTN